MNIDWNALYDRARELAHDPIPQAVIGAVVMLFVLAGCRLAGRTGHHPALGLLFFVPGVNLLVFLWLAFLPWPVRTELSQLRKVQKASRRAEARVQRAA